MTLRTHPVRCSKVHTRMTGCKMGLLEGEGRKAQEKEIPI